MLARTGRQDVERRQRLGHGWLTFRPPPTCPPTAATGTGPGTTVASSAASALVVEGMTGHSTLAKYFDVTSFRSYDYQTAL